MTFRVLSSLVSLLFLLYAPQSPRRCRAAIPVEGDRDLLSSLHAVQVTNESIFDRGRLTATVDARLARIKVDATIVWDGEKTFWDYVLQEPVKGPAPPSVSDEIKWFSRHEFLIEKSGVLWWYGPHAKLAQKITDGSRGYHDELRLRPDQLWFQAEGHKFYKWKGFLDPDRAAEGSGRIVVSKNSDDSNEVVVDRHFTNGTVCRLIFSWNVGGNLIRYETTEVGDQSTWRKGSYDWAQDERRHWYVKRYDYKHSILGDPDKLDMDCTVEILEFDPTYEIPEDRFEFSSLMVGKGTTVEEIARSRPQKTYRIGGQSTPFGVVDQAILDNLAKELRSSGFASPMIEE